jgi:hypothetical protein
MYDDLFQLIRAHFETDQFIPLHEPRFSELDKEYVLDIGVRQIDLPAHGKAAHRCLCCPISRHRGCFLFPTLSPLAHRETEDSLV